MARPPAALDDLVRQYGPHRNDAPPGGYEESSRHPPDRLVETHCCFCGQQCGIRLKVKDNAVVGFEPWEEFPFNRGMLCPKGVRRYLQNAHSDRLLDPLIRAEGGFRPAGWDEALDTVVDRMTDIQRRHGKDAVALYGGASLTTEKTYLLGKLARLGFGTRHIDYNGRLCMVSAGTAYKLTFGVDRSPNPWSDLPKAQVLFVAGSNVAECSPITTDYVWRCRDNGGRLIVSDPRMTPITRNADLYLPVRPGTDLALFLGMLRVIIEADLVDRAFVESHTTGYEALATSVQEWTLPRTADVTGVPAEAIERAARWIGEADRAMGLHARGIEHQSKGVENCLAMLNLFLVTGQFGREGAGCVMITGQGNGQGGREHGQKCDQLPGQRSISDPAARAHVALVWGVSPEEIPQAGLSAMEIMEAIHRGEIKGLLSMCFNPLVSLPDAGYVQEALSKLEFFGVIDFFLSETAHHADVVLAGSLHEEEEGIVTSAEGRVIHIRQAVTPPANARTDTDILLDVARRLGKEKYFPFRTSGDILDELRRASKGGPADYGGITYEKIDRQMGVFWPCPTEDHPGTPRLFEGGQFFHEDARAHLQASVWRESGDPVDEGFPLYLTTGRVVSQYLSGTQTRRIGPLVDQYPEPRAEIHPRLADTLGIKDGDWVAITTRRGELRFRAMVVKTIRPDTVFVPYHWAGERSINRLTHRTLDARSKIPEYKVSACRVAKADAPPKRLPVALPQTGSERRHSGAESTPAPRDGGSGGAVSPQTRSGAGWSREGAHPRDASDRQAGDVTPAPR